MPRKGELMSDEQKRIRSDAAKRQHAEGRGNSAGLSSPEAREKTRLKMLGHKRTPTGDSHWLWKGEDAGYVSKHMWLNLHFAKSGICEHCKKQVGTKKPKCTDWANISGNYLRDRADFLELCRSCHRLYDYEKHPEQKLRSNSLRVEGLGDTLTISEWAQRLGMTRTAIYKRIKRGKTIDEIASW